MYNNESFDDYIRSILGYPNINGMHMDGMYMNTNNMQNEYNMASRTSISEDLEGCYPEIYKIVYPMIAQRCSRTSEPITGEIVENMTDEIYNAIEVNNEVNLNINLQNEVTNNRKESRNSLKGASSKESKNENRGEDRQFGNSNLRDLIKILLIRELIRRHRRPMPGPGRPPFPGRPSFLREPGPSRPPIMPREYNNIDIYEQF